MRVIFLSLILLVSIFSCENADNKSATPPAATPTNNTNTTAAANNTTNNTAYTLSDISGSDMQLAVLKTADGLVQEQGYMLNGQKTGMWTMNHAGSSIPGKIFSYVNGQLNGPYYELNDRGQIELIANYSNNQLHGAWIKIRFGRQEIVTNYLNGQLDGVYTERDFKNGKLKREVHYKNGKEHGPMRYYDGDEKLTTEFIYENGKKVSGGIIGQ